MTDSQLTFEEWFQIISSFEDSEAMWNADERVHNLSPIQVTCYLRQMLTESPLLCQGLSPARLSSLIWFFQGICSSYWHQVLKPEVPHKEQIAAILALKIFYSEFLDSYLLTTPGDLDDVETAVYMMWDMDGLEGAAMFPEGNSSHHLVDPIFEVMGAALRCKSFACQQSALHGLGHQARYHPDRVKTEIDWALSQKGHLHSALRSYASDARIGAIQ